jgi:hypothetical protein
MKGRMASPRCTGSAGVPPAGWEADFASGEVSPADKRRLLHGMAWAAAIACPFWWALLALLTWL